MTTGKQFESEYSVQGPLSIGSHVSVLSSGARGWVKATVVASNSEAARVRYQIGNDLYEKSVFNDSGRLQIPVESNEDRFPSPQMVEQDPEIRLSGSLGRPAGSRVQRHDSWLIDRDGQRNDRERPLQKWYIDLADPHALDNPNHVPQWKPFNPPGGIIEIDQQTALKYGKKGTAEFEYTNQWPGSYATYTYRVTFSSATHGVQENMQVGTRRTLYREQPMIHEPTVDEDRTEQVLAQKGGKVRGDPTAKKACEATGAKKAACDFLAGYSTAVVRDK